MSQVSPFRRVTNPQPLNERDVAAATRRRLKAAVLRIATLEELSAIVAQSRSPGAMLAYLRPMLRKEMPCCRLISAGEHTENCPARLQEQSATATSADVPAGTYRSGEVAVNMDEAHGECRRRLADAIVGDQGR